MKKSSMRVKGFTLTEMIIVIAIIGVLAGILAPTMTTYYWKSRVKSSNTDAKMVYNAAQTAAQRFIAKDRTATDGSGLSDVLIISYDNNGTVQYSTQVSPYVWNSDMSSSVGQAVTEIVDSVNRTVSNAEQRCWTVYISNYIVEGSISAESNATTLVGYYSSGTVRIPESRPDVNYLGYRDGASTGNTTYPASLADVVGKYAT